jgi:hypothetical protein
MTDTKPVLTVDDLHVETIGVVPAADLEDLTQGHGLTELGASCDCGSCDLLDLL